MKKMNIDITSFNNEMKLKEVSHDANAHEDFFNGIVDTQNILEYLSAVAFTIKLADTEEEKLEITTDALEKIKSLKISTLELNPGKKLWVQYPVVLVESKYEIPFSSRIKTLLKRRMFLGKVAYARTVQVITNTEVPLQMRVNKIETKVSENPFVNDFFISISYLAYKISAMCEKLQVENISIFQNEGAIIANNSMRNWMERSSKDKDYGYSDVNLSEAISYISLSELLTGSNIFDESEREDLELIEIALDDEIDDDGEELYEENI